MTRPHTNGATPKAVAVEAVVPRFRKGDYCRRLPAGPIGIVLRTDRNRVLMHWGTDQLGEHTDWVPKIELEHL